MPRVVAIDAERPDAAAIAAAAAVLAKDGLVAFPTETVYGLGARGLSPAAVAKIFAAKERPVGHPLILHVDGEDRAKALASSWPSLASALARAFWPGPLTLVVARSAVVPDAVTGGLDSVAVRAPNHRVALALIAVAGEPLAAPSANAHMHVSPTTAAHVVRSLGDRIDMVLDAGPCTHGIESTVVDVRGPAPRVLRAGAVTLEQLRAVAPDVTYDVATLTVSGEGARAAPGMASKHYAPRARVVLVEGASATLAAAVEANARGERAGVIVRSDHAEAASLPFTAVLADDAAGYARALFAAFYDADEAKLDTLFVERVPDAEAWWAVADRLRRAETR